MRANLQKWDTLGVSGFPVPFARFGEKGRREWGVGSGEWAVGSGEWGIGSGEWAQGAGSGE